MPSSNQRCLVEPTFFSYFFCFSSYANISFLILKILFVFRERDILHIEDTIKKCKHQNSNVIIQSVMCDSIYFFWFIIVFHFLKFHSNLRI